MKAMQRRKSGPVNWSRASAAFVLLAFFCACTAHAQSAAPSPTGASRAGDVVQARQFLMDALEEQMMAIEVALARNEGRLPELKNRAYLMNVLMSAFPHLFPPETKGRADGEDPGYETGALMTVWTRFDLFYEASQKAATIALDASQAPDMSSFRELGQKLRGSCDSCHSVFMASAEPSKP